MVFWFLTELLPGFGGYQRGRITSSTSYEKHLLQAAPLGKEEIPMQRNYMVMYSSAYLALGLNEAFKTSGYELTKISTYVLLSMLVVLVHRNSK